MNTLKEFTRLKEFVQRVEYIYFQGCKAIGPDHMISALEQGLYSYAGRDKALKLFCKASFWKYGLELDPLEEQFLSLFNTFLPRQVDDDSYDRKYIQYKINEFQ